MSLDVSVDGASILDGIPPGSVQAAQMAQRGETAFGGFDVEDPAATLTITGHRPVTITESECSQPRLFTGWTTARAVGRDKENGMVVAAEREHDVTIADLNALFGFRMITGTDGNRPAETWSARLTWLLGSSYLSGLIADTGYVRTITQTMDATDYRNSYPRSVCDDLVDRIAHEMDYFAFWDPVALTVGLYFDHYEDAVSLSTLRISNVPGDYDGVTTFEPDAVAKLTREPDQTYSGVVVEYKNGKVYRHRQSTADAYIERSTKISRPYTSLLSTAITQAEWFLDQHAGELDRITVTITVPPSVAGLVWAGQRMSVKFSHMPGYTTWTSMRVIACSAQPTDDSLGRYAIALELVSPRAAVSPPPSCGGAWTGSAAYGKTVAATTSTPGHEIITPENLTDGTGAVAVFNEGVFDTGTYYDQWRIDLGSSHRVTAITVVVLGGVAYAVSIGLGIEISDSATWAGATPGTMTESDYGGWNPDVTGLTNYGTFRPTTPTTGRYIFIRRDWVRTGLGYDPGWEFYEVLVCGEVETVVDLGPAPGVPTQATTDPTVTDDADAGFEVGDHWINTTSGQEFVVTDVTPGAAVWVSTTAVSVFEFSVTDGTTTVDPTTSVTFVGATVADLGSGNAEITLTGILNNLAATTNPAVTDDSGDGYEIGSRWINTATDEEFVATDVTVGAAVWVSTTAAAGAPATVDYLVGTASGDLSAEIVVGTTPGGELGGTWASPTVDATHSGSAHVAPLIDAKGDLIVGSAADTAARLPVNGSNTWVLTQDSGETLGVKWAEAAGTSLPLTTPGDILYMSSGTYTNQATGALGASATAQSTYGGWPTSNMIDGNDATGWASNDYIPQWVAIDLGTERTINRVRILQTDAAQRATDYDVYYGSNGTDYTFLESHVTSGADETFNLSAPTAARYWKFNATASSSTGWHIYALELHLLTGAALARLAIGTTGQVLTVAGGLPSWATP
jgi:hypothetical protein